MTNERDDKYEGQEESEYHFSDDQITYETETETSKDTSPAAPGASTSKNKILAKLIPYRRMIIGIVAVIAVLFIVYKIVAPSSKSTASAPIIAQNNAGVINPPVKTESPIISKQQPKEALAPQSQLPSVQPSPQPSVQAQGYQPPAPMQAQSFAPPAQTSGASISNNYQNQINANNPLPMEAAAQPQTPASESTTNSQQYAQSLQPMPQPSSTQQPLPQQSIPQPPIPQQPMNVPMPNPQADQAMLNPMVQAPAASTAPPIVIAPESPAASNATKSIPERLAALEDQNARLIALLQTQYAQKIAENEAQNNVTQEKINELNKRFANVEAALAKMAQFIQGKAPVMNRPAVMRSEPRIAFSVQAIIPGRAWLKSASGETVTVAEGDMLKNIGRVTKIDPYDGIVDIDTGSKIISLSYGASSE